MSETDPNDVLAWSLLAVAVLASWVAAFMFALEAAP